MSTVILDDGTKQATVQPSNIDQLIAESYRGLDERPAYAITIMMNNGDEPIVVSTRDTNAHNRTFESLNGQMLNPKQTPNKVTIKVEQFGKIEQSSIPDKNDIPMPYPVDPMDYP
ncbi:MAG: hypothetical protein ABIR91_05865 [Candidatus Saccharimonadales bacterium]